MLNRTYNLITFFIGVTTELSGTEDPIFLYPIVLNWSVKGAVKEGR